MDSLVVKGAQGESTAAPQGLLVRVGYPLVARAGEVDEVGHGEHVGGSGDHDEDLTGGSRGGG